MSQKRVFFWTVGRMVRDPALSPVLVRLVGDLGPVRDALDRGDIDAARSVLDDLLARALLRSALGDDWQY